jgi:hypothetical protein
MGVLIMGMNMRVRFVRVLLVRMPGLIRGSLRRYHVHIRCRQAATGHLAHLKPRTHIQCGRRLRQGFERNARIHQGAQQHVSANPGKTFQISDSHALLF